MRVIRKSEFARLLGISPSRVSQYIAESILHKSLLPDGRLDLDIALREIGANISELKVLEYKLRYDVVEKRMGKK